MNETKTDLNAMQQRQTMAHQHTLMALHELPAIFAAESVCFRCIPLRLATTTLVAGVSQCLAPYEFIEETLHQRTPQVHWIIL
jgi:hypothetical protein